MRGETFQEVQYDPSTIKHKRVASNYGFDLIRDGMGLQLSMRNGNSPPGEALLGRPMLFRRLHCIYVFFPSVREALGISGHARQRVKGECPISRILCSIYLIDEAELENRWKESNCFVVFRLRKKFAVRSLLFITAKIIEKLCNSVSKCPSEKVCPVPQRRMMRPHASRNFQYLEIR